jgi:dienelactone hydrolase
MPSSRWLSAVLASFLLAATASAAGAQSGAPERLEFDVKALQSLPFETVEFPSLDTAGFLDPKPVPIKGLLLKAPGPAPGAVLAPACNGLIGEDGRVFAHYRRMAKFLNDMGMTVLLVDGFNPRGRREVCTQPSEKRSIDTEVRMKDSLGGLRYLRGRGDVRPDRVFMVTWGAAGSFQAMNAGSEEVAALGSGFAAAVLFYPECNRVDGAFAPYAPIIAFGGDKDTWNPPGHCLALAGRRAAGSQPFEMHVYPDTYHGFDQPRPPSMHMGAAVGPQMTGGNPESMQDAYRKTKAFLSGFLGSPG